MAIEQPVELKNIVVSPVERHEGSGTVFILRGCGPYELSAPNPDERAFIASHYPDIAEMVAAALPGPMVA
jgi:hypothetical protein